MKKKKAILLSAIGKIWMVMLAACLLVGCCKDDTDQADWLTNVLRRHPLTTFVDSSNNYLQIMIVDTGFESRPSSDYVNDRDGCTGYSPKTIGIFFPATEGTLFSYKQLYNYNMVKVLDVSFSTTGYYSYPVQTRTADTSLFLQGFEFQHCRHFKQVDSLGFRQELALSPEFGLVLFAFRDEYRWERVLNP
jgi:hypothetical protein